MNAYCEVFERIEKKYVISAEQRYAIEGTLTNCMRPDEYGETEIVSLYWDTARNELIGRSLEGPPYKEKLRLRAYGGKQGEELICAFSGASYDPSTPVFCEMKKKFDGVVYKRRVSVSLGAAKACFDGVSYSRACEAFPLNDASAQAEVLSARGIQIAREIQAMVRRHAGIEARMAIACKRLAWVASEGAEEGLRITFDSSLGYCSIEDIRRFYDKSRVVAGQSNNIWSAFESMNTTIMEIKNAGPYPLWLTSLLSEQRTYPSSFSKYGYAYQTSEKRNRLGKSLRHFPSGPVLKGSYQII